MSDRLPGFTRPLLDEAVGVGSTGESSSRIWFRVRESGNFRVAYQSGGGAYGRTEPVRVITDGPSDGTATVQLE
ncbi:MAG: hypothetical protein WBG86_17740, partial [Polyangiales bacterium]